MENEKDILCDFTIVLPEAQEKLNRQFNSITKLQDFAKTMFGVSGIALSLFSAIISMQDKYFSLSINILLFILIMVSYIFLTYYNIKSILPISLEHALNPSWETYSRVCCGMSKEKSYEILVSQYLEAIKNNEPILIEQYERSKDICVAFAILMFVIFLQSVIMGLA